MLTDFLHFNRHCPLCGEPLGLYMQWIGSLCFRAKELEPNVYDFNAILGLEKDEPEKGNYSLSTAQMILIDHGSHLETQFSSPSLFNDAKRYRIYFYFLCNPLGIKKKAGGKHEINLYKGCYYRSSPFMEFQNKEDNWSLQFLAHETEDPAINKQESFAIKRHNNSLEKVYMLSLNHDKKETAFWFYSVTDDQKKDNKFKPNLFEKKMPLLPNRPNFENREKLIERFDSWIIMS